jgi:non-ribosomal peptide synthetase component F
MSNSFNTNKREAITKLDFSVLVEHDFDMNQLSCTINASLDLFKTETVDKIAQRFHSMLEQLFHVKHNQMAKPIHELSLILSDERILLKSINNTQVIFPSVTCIHHEFVYQVIKHPQKLAVELDEQSLTYCELLYFVQLLSLNLLKEQNIAPGDIICQCVERSLSMVSWSLKSVFILIKAFVFCRLSVSWQSKWLVVCTVHYHLEIHNIVYMHFYNKLKVVLFLYIVPQKQNLMMIL